MPYSHTWLKAQFLAMRSIGIGVGATIVTKAKYDKLSSQTQQILRETAHQYHQDLIRQIREDNDKSVVSLQKKARVQIVAVSNTDAKQ